MASDIERAAFSRGVRSRDDEIARLNLRVAEQTARADQLAELYQAASLAHARTTLACGKAEDERDAILADFSRELDEARKQITEHVMGWARKSGCVYCGEVFDTLGPEGAGDARRALYTAHTELCIKHPLRDVERERDQALAANAELRKALGLAATECQRVMSEIADAMHGPTLQPLAQRVRGYVETCDRLNETVGALTAWTHEYGAALKPPGANTYGEGKRDAKNEVAAILRGKA